MINGPRRKHPGEAVPLGCHLNVECDRQWSHFSAFLKIIVVLGLPFPAVEGEILKIMEVVGWGGVDGTAQRLLCNKSPARWNSSK